MCTVCCVCVCVLAASIPPFLIYKHQHVESTRHVCCAVLVNVCAGGTCVLALMLRPLGQLTPTRLSWSQWRELTGGGMRTTPCCRCVLVCGKVKGCVWVRELRLSEGCGCHPLLLSVC